MKSTVANLWKNRRLVSEIVRFRLKSTAVDNRLGMFYWLVDPVLMILVYWFVFSILRASHNYAPYPIFIGCAIVSWKYFTRCLSNGLKTFNSHGATMRSIPFPTIVLPSSTVIEEGILFIFGLIALICVAITMGLMPTLFLLQLIPLVTLQITLMFGIALLSAYVGAIIYDINLYLDHAIRLGFYLSPTLYGLDLLSHFLGGREDLLFAYMILNPFALLFSGYRYAIWSPDWIPLWWYCVLAIHALIFAYTGYYLYSRNDRKLLKTATF